MRALYFFSLFTLCGCAGKWVSNGLSSESFGSADHTCTLESRKMYPVRNEVAQRTRFEQQVEKCKKKEDCDGKNYKVTEVPGIESYAMDVNEDSRKDHYKACMQENGWTKQYSLF